MPALESGMIVVFVCDSTPAYGSKVRSVGPAFVPGLEPGASTKLHQGRQVLMAVGVLASHIRKMRDKAGHASSLRV